MTPRHVPLSRAAPIGARVLFALTLAAIVALVISGAGSSAPRHVAVLASSSAPFAASSPATTLATVPSAPSSSTPTATTLPTANTGRAWGSPWFVAVLLLGALSGLACLWPALARRAPSEV